MRDETLRTSAWEATVMPAEPVYVALFLTELAITARERDLGPSTLS